MYLNFAFYSSNVAKDLAVANFKHFVANSKPRENKKH